MRLNQSLLPMRDYQLAKKLMWNPQDIDYHQDQIDWAGVSAREQDLLRRALALYLGGEVSVTRDLAPLLIALRREGDHLEEEMFITAQLFEESKHVEFFADALDQVVGDTGDANAMAGPSYRELFETELAGALGRLLTDHSRPAQAEAVVTCHLIIEGALVETGYYGIFAALKANGVMPGLLRGLELVQRDEARHVAFGLHLLTRLMTEDPALWDVVEARVNHLFPLATGVFTELCVDFLPDIPFGLDPNNMMAYASAQRQARLAALQRARRV